MPSRLTLWLLSVVLIAPLGTRSVAVAAESVKKAEKPKLLDVRKRLIDKPGEIVAVLSNGLTVIAKEHRTAPVASVRMVVKTGSIYEDDHLGAGLSHLFEHLLHGGTTKNRTEDESRTILQELGGNSNAATSMWYTFYYVTTGRDDLAKATNLLADWITNPTFPESEFRREWGVVQRELERDVGNPQRQLWYLLMETMYADHPARFPIIGHQPIVQSLTKDEIVAYYRERYVPDNVIVAMAGDVDAEKMLTIARREFTHFQRRPVPEVLLPEPARLVTPRTVVKQMTMSKSTALMQMCWPSIRLTHPDLYALDVLSYILTHGRSSRLVQSIVRDQQLAYAVNSFSWTPHWGRGLFAIMTVSSPDKREACRKAILAEIIKVRDDLVSADELAKVKRQKAAEHIFGQQTAESVASSMATDLISTGDAHFSDAYVDGIQKVTAEQVRDVARKYLDPKLFATIAVVPEGDQDKATAERADRPGPIKKVVLDNGLRMLLRRDPSVPIVTMQAFFKSGLLSETPETNGVSNLVAQLATRGTTSRSAEEIAAFFDSRGGSISGQSGNNTIYYTASVLKDDMAKAAEVFADVVLNPSFPKDELERLRPRVLNAIDQINDQWRSELTVFFRKRFFEKSPYGLVRIGRTESVKALSPADLKAHHETYVTAPNGVVAVFGDIDLAQAERVVREAFGEMPRASAPELNLAREEAVSKDRLFVKTSKQPAVAGIMLGFRGTTYANVNKRFPIETLDCIMSGASLPSGWLHHELREGTRDLVYEVHAINFVGLAPGYFGIYAGCQPEKVGEVYRIIREQCAKAVQGHITQEELDTAKGVMMTTEQLQSRTNAEMATRAALDELYGLGYDAHTKFEERVNAVTLDDVKRAADELLTHAVITVVTPKPEAVDLGIEPTIVD